MADFLSEVRNLRVFGVSKRTPTLMTDFLAHVGFWCNRRKSLDSSRCAASFLSINCKLLTKSWGWNLTLKSLEPTWDTFSKTRFFTGKRGFYLATSRLTPKTPYTRKLHTLTEITAVPLFRDRVSKLADFAPNFRDDKNSWIQLEHKTVKNDWNEESHSIRHQK